MKVPKPVTCSICGGLLVLCVHAQVGQFVEALHPHTPSVLASLVKEALPPEPLHAPDDYRGTARIELVEVGVNGSSSSNILPPGNGNMVTDTANLIARRRPYYPSASMVFTMPPPLPLATATTTSS